jgi:hypothetical protein
VGRLLREMVIGAFEYDDYPTSWSGCITALADSGVPKTLRRLEFCNGGYWDISTTQLGDLSPLYPQLVHLEELRIELGAMDLGAVALPALRALELVSGGLTSENVASITAARWPQLEKLSLYIGETGNDYGCTVELVDLRPILAGRGLERVTWLGLGNSSLADEICAALPGAPILPQLRVLDLSHGTLGDEGARVLLDNAATFEHLEKLDLTRSFIGKELAAELTQRLPRVIVANQETADDYRYVAISE